ncbi:MAG: c-type cytochrome [Daejeonella sp.]|uniref:c-type cytochrome n=1 Tax=Daejeonella sp. TaxID=2805397 RepID=UPI003C793BB0
MKKLALILGICSVIAACSNSETKSTDNTSAGADQAATAQQSNVDTNVNNIGTSSTGTTGAELIKKSDCLSCHKEDVKLLGPAYQDVAAKYPATEENIELLAGKIIKGGSGNWGDIPMAPHPTISENDAKEMVKYILSLKK